MILQHYHKLTLKIRDLPVQLQAVTISKIGDEKQVKKLKMGVLALAVAVAMFAVALLPAQGTTLAKSPQAIAVMLQPRAASTVPSAPQTLTATVEGPDRI